MVNKGLTQLYNSVTLITTTELNPKTKLEEIVISHGIDANGNNVILPCETLEYYKKHGAVYDDHTREWEM